MRIAGVRLRSDFKEIVLEVVGRALKNGLLVDDILAGIVPALVGLTVGRTTARNWHEPEALHQAIASLTCERLGTLFAAATVT